MILATRYIEAFLQKCVLRLEPLCARELEHELEPGPRAASTPYSFLPKALNLTHNSVNSPLSHTTLVCRDADRIDARGLPSWLSETSRRE